MGWGWSPGDLLEGRVMPAHSLSWGVVSSKKNRERGPEVKCRLSLGGGLR